MPSAVVVKGLKIYRPGVYGIIDASSLGGIGISTGNVAVVGKFLQVEHSNVGDANASGPTPGPVPLTFTSARAVADFDAQDIALQTIAKTLFAPSLDSRIPGGASSVTFANIQKNGLATYTIVDSAGDDSIKLSAKMWGPKGNQTFVKIETNATDTDAIDISLARAGTTEFYENVQSGAVAKFKYTGSDLTTSSLTFDDEVLDWDWTVGEVFAAGGGAQSQVTDFTTMVATGTIAPTLANGAAGASAANVTVTLEGLKADGAPVTSTVTFASTGTVPDTANFQSGGVDLVWGRVDKMTAATTDAAYDGTLTLTGKAFDITLADFDSVADLCSFLNNNSNKGFTATAEHVRAGSIDTFYLDKQTAAATQGAFVTARSDLWATLQALDGSALIEADRVTGANLPSTHHGAPTTSEQDYMKGGLDLGSNDLEGTLEGLEHKDIQIVVLESDDILDMQKVVTHCKKSATAGYERNGYVACPASKSLSEVFEDFTKKLNSRHVALCAQEVFTEDAAGKTDWRAPFHLALRLAGMQAGSPVATPLTWKRPTLLDVRQKWDANRDASEVIQKGFINLSRDNLGWKVERSITTYMEDDNPIYSEVSANESVNTTVRDLRAKLLIQIGNPVYAKTAAKMRGTVEARLDAQVLAGYIKAWQNVILVDLGDTITITYEVAAVEPLNFIVVTASVIRIPGV